MKAIVGLIAALFFLFYSFPASAAIIFTLSDPQKNENEVTFNVSITGLTSSSCPNTTCFLQAAFTPQDTTHYFGYTKNHNGEWFEYVSSPETDYIKSTLSAFEPKNSSWSGTLTIRPDVTDYSYTGTKMYDIKAWRYTGNSKSYSGVSDNVVSIELTAPTSTPTITPTSEPTNTPLPTSAPTPTKTLTPTPITNTPTSRPSLAPTLKLFPTSILGESTESGVIALANDAESFDKNILVSNESKNTNSTWLQKVLIFVGIVFLAACAILTAREIKKRKLTQNEQEKFS